MWWRHPTPRSRIREIQYYQGILTERATGIEPAFSAWEVGQSQFRHLRLLPELAFYQDFLVRRLPASYTEFRTVRARIAHDGPLSRCSKPRLARWLPRTSRSRPGRYVGVSWRRGSSPQSGPEAPRRTRPCRAGCSGREGPLGSSIRRRGQGGGRRRLDLGSAG